MLLIQDKTQWRKRDDLPGAGMQMWQAKRKFKSYANANALIPPLPREVGFARHLIKAGMGAGTLYVCGETQMGAV